MQKLKSIFKKHDDDNDKRDSGHLGLSEKVHPQKKKKRKRKRFMQQPPKLMDGTHTGSQPLAPGAANVIEQYQSDQSNQSRQSMIFFFFFSFAGFSLQGYFSEKLHTELGQRHCARLGICLRQYQTVSDCGRKERLVDENGLEDLDRGLRRISFPPQPFLSFFFLSSSLQMLICTKLLMQTKKKIQTQIQCHSSKLQLGTILPAEVTKNKRLQQFLRLSLFGFRYASSF
jgi:hypothetical protein